jgi:hypothetical protein
MHICGMSHVVKRILDFSPHRYEKFVDALDEAAKDKLPFLKEKAVKVTFTFCSFSIRFIFR